MTDRDSLVAAAQRVQEEFGGADVLSYREMMHRYAAVAGLRHRVIIPVPVLTPYLASQWVGFVTPVPTGVAKPLVGSLVHEGVAKENDMQGLGSAVTYARRYMCAAMNNLSQSDDDGNAASTASKAKAPVKASPKVPSKPSDEF